jgi:hypothetical protein
MTGGKLDKPIKPNMQMIHSETWILWHIQQQIIILNRSFKSVGIETEHIINIIQAVVSCFVLENCGSYHVSMHDVGLSQYQYNTLHSSSSYPYSKPNSAELLKHNLVVTSRGTILITFHFRLIGGGWLIGGGVQSAGLFFLSKLN